MASYLIKGATLVNRGTQYVADVLISQGQIVKTGQGISHPGATEINADGLHLLPGMIDDQVHFRQPGLTAKGDIYTESRAAVAGGITSYMEMPNTIPNAVTIPLLEDKYAIAAQNSLANYSFYLGGTNDNLQVIESMDVRNICGVKVFMGSSTGNMLVDDDTALENIFKASPTLIATHCEDENTIRQNLAEYKQRYGDDITPAMHPLIRSAQACWLSSSRAVALAQKHNARLHILHISTAKELSLFSNTIPLAQKRITAEACIHHLWFNNEDYETLGNLIKWNPAVKTEEDRAAILAAVTNGRIDVIATDHAPHLLSEKEQPYLQAPSGGPLVQHALPALLHMHNQGLISLETIVQKTAHNVAECFSIAQRGYIDEGYMADLVLVNLKGSTTVTPQNVLYKCGWSPFMGQTFSASVEKTFVSGVLAYSDGKICTAASGQRMHFNR